MWARWAGGGALYAVVLIINLAVTAAIGEWPLFLAGVLIHSPSLAWLLVQGYGQRTRMPGEGIPAQEGEQS